MKKLKYILKNHTKILVAISMLAVIFMTFIFKHYLQGLEVPVEINNPYFSSQETYNPKTTYVRGSLAARSIDDLFMKSSLAVFGEVVGVSDSFQIEHYTGSLDISTDYYIAVSDVFRGETEADLITVRLSGGTIGEFTLVYDPNPALDIGSEYLLFLCQPGSGGAFNTEGDYYYVLGNIQGVFSYDGEQKYISQFGEEITAEYLLHHGNAATVDKDYFRNEFIKNASSNLESGFFSQEYHDELMEQMDIYATIKPPDAVVTSFNKNLQNNNNNNLKFTVTVTVYDGTTFDVNHVERINGQQKGSRTFEYDLYTVYVAWNDNNTVTVCEVR